MIDSSGQLATQLLDDVLLRAAADDDEPRVRKLSRDDPPRVSEAFNVLVGLE